MTISRIDRKYLDLKRFLSLQQKIFFSKADFTDSKTTNNVIPISPKHIKELFIKKMKIKPKKITSQIKGSLHRLYIVDDFVLKVRTDNNYKSYWFFMEKYINNRLEKNHLPNVKTYLIDLSRKTIPFDYEIIEKIKGKSMYKLSLSKKIKPNTIFLLGAFVGRINKIKTKKFGPLNLSELTLRKKMVGIYDNWSDFIFLNLNRHLTYLRSVLVINQSQKKNIYKLFSTNRNFLLNSPSFLLHGDVAHHNVFVKNNKILGIIDWEDA